MIISPGILLIKKSPSDIPSVLKDGNTNLWFDAKYLPNIEKDSSNYVSKVHSRLGQIAFLNANEGSTQPIYNTQRGLIFNGITSYMNAVIAPLHNFGGTIYFVLKRRELKNDYILFVSTSNYCVYYGILQNNYFSFLTNDRELAYIPDTFDDKVVSNVIINGAESKHYIIKTSGTNLLSGTLYNSTIDTIMLGGFYGGSNSPIDFMDLIIRTSIDDSITRGLIINYLRKKWEI